MKLFHSGMPGNQELAHLAPRSVGGVSKITASQTLNRCYNIMELREIARRRLPSPIFDMLDGAAEDETTARQNTRAFDEVKLVPRCLVDVATISTATRILGQEIAWPMLCSPTGASRLFHPDGERAVARAAAMSGALYCVSTSSTFSLEDVAAASAAQKVFQLYIHKNRDITRELIERCKRARYAALCLTVDVPVVGKRERDLRSGFGLHPRWSVKSRLSFARHPLWVAQRIRKKALALANTSSYAGTTSTELDPSVTWKDVREISDLWQGPFALKGVMSSEDACHAVDVGATAIIVSNHGGRQLDGAAAPIQVLPDIVRALSGRADVVLDGGIRRGVHVLKALALGAKACSIGRPYLYGLAAGGEAGVAKALDILRTELALAMQLSGCADLQHVDGTLVRHY